MKKVFKTICIVLAVLLATSVIPAMADSDRVEITFCVGDDTLLINSAPVKVEKPYVVGEGVTLVPLRVITEAFGAKVDWDDATSSVTLTYPDVSILLQINNPIAEVNGKAETLLSAPELTNDFTMVPLRFISETFGATVSYDEATEKITVTKSKTETGSVVEGAIDNDKLGDSFYGWIMSNPKNMKMELRSFDGTETRFVCDDGEISISISPMYEDFDFEKEFVDTKTELTDFTLVKADKGKDNYGNNVMNFQFKNKETFFNYRFLATDKYTYVVGGLFDAKADSQIKEMIDIVESFALNFVSGAAYDLSNVNGNVRKFEDEELNFSLNIPANYYQDDSDSTMNKFCFRTTDINDSISDISICVYSISEVGDALALAKEDYNHNKTVLNEEITKFDGEVTTNVYKNFSSYEYTFTIDSTAGKQYSRDVFFENGDYVYNISVSKKLPTESAEKFINEIVNSFEFEAVDKDKVGVLLRSIPTATGTFNVNGDKISVDIPNNYTYTKGNPIVCTSPISGATITISSMAGTKANNISELISALKQLESDAYKAGGAKVIDKAAAITFDNRKFAYDKIKVVDDDDAVYIENYFTYSSRAIILVSITYPELTYSESARNEVKDILRSMKF